MFIFPVFSLFLLLFLICFTVFFGRRVLGVFLSLLPGEWATEWLTQAGGSKQQRGNALATTAGGEAWLLPFF